MEVPQLVVVLQLLLGYARDKGATLVTVTHDQALLDHFQRVVDSERALVLQEDQWANARGDIALNLIAMYKALGGGWEIREGNDVISGENREAMQQRTNWGDLLEPESEQEQNNTGMLD